MYDLGGEQLSSGYSSTDRDSCYLAESVDDRCAPRLATPSAGRDEGGSSEEEEEEGGGARPRPRLGRRWLRPMCKMLTHAVNKDP